ncbi:MAG: nucleoside recognition protein [Candidatus Melainabacteria bacterium]|nr:MAG: nucleoside recognition protein [Candidatus Melainabacteria bacterium]
MNYIFYFLIVISIVIGAINGRLSEVVNAILTGADKSVKIALSLAGIMAFWLGIMKIAEKSGLVELFARLIKPITKRLFPDIPEEDAAIGDIAMNFSANALGLTNAATPIGLKAMKELQEHNKNKKTASNAMCMFLGMNTASFQLVPATVIAVLVGAGYQNPTEIIAPTLIVTSFTFLCAIFLAKVFEKISPPQTESEGE